MVCRQLLDSGAYEFLPKVESRARDGLVAAVVCRRRLGNKIKETSKVELTDLCRSEATCQGKTEVSLQES